MTVMKLRRNFAPGAASQQGFSLIMTMLFMVSALVLGVSVMGVNVMQERIIGNTRDKNLALQAAEAALRDAERDIRLSITPATDFRDDCLAGLCSAPSFRSPISALPVDRQVGFSWTSAANVRTYGQFTASAALPSVSAQPVYVIERIGDMGMAVGQSMGMGINPQAPGTAFRITTRATGARPETVVILQSIFALR